MKIEIYVQARMGSTRLPGKVMMPVLNKPLLGHLIERLWRVKEADAFAILTTNKPEDDEIVSFCKKEGIPCYRGSENDVLDRYHSLAVSRRPDAIVRITGDCPLIDPDIVDLVIRTYRDDKGKYDYVSNTLELTFPRGLDTEIFSYKALERAFRESKDPYEREHVTAFFYRHPELFKLKNVPSMELLSNFRWTVDTQEDYELVRLIIEHLSPIKPDFRLLDILQLFKQHPEWNLINAHIKQKNQK
ncbi:MAG: glycosyltransferase family protein [Parachlamydiaceae bacterium]|nr:glycosyltransferase family protein [Parachlamydiaceae bacterium]